MTFDTSLVDRARARRRRRWERERRATLSRLLRLLDQHGAQLGISEAYVFGSLAQPGRFRERSDIDVAVEEIDAESFFRAMSLLSATLGRPVDLVELNACHFADRIRERHPMDRQILVLLVSDLKAQLALIDETFDRVEQRASGLRSGDDAQLESTAYQLHNLYNAVEDLFKIVADAFENQMADTARWHIRLLRRMSHDIDGVRPALLSQESYRLLDGLRSFRLFFRHAYAAPIDYERLRLNLDKARQLRPLLERDVERFLQRIGKATDGHNNE